jgi:hypothetical protein
VANFIRYGSCNRLDVCHGVLLLPADVDDMAWRSPRFRDLDQKERVEKSTPIGAVIFNVVTPTLKVSAPAGCRRTSKLCCTNLWRTVWRDAGHSGKTASHLFSVGAGRRLGPRRSD